MNEFEFEFRLADGRTLVVSGHVRDDVEEIAETDPATFGTLLLNALGLGAKAARPVVLRPSTERKRVPRARAPLPPAEENADTWLRQTSEQALGVKFKRETRARGDDAP